MNSTNYRPDAFVFRVCSVCQQAGRFKIEVDDQGRRWHVIHEADGSVTRCGEVRDHRALPRTGQAPRAWTPPPGFYRAERPRGDPDVDEMLEAMRDDR